MSRAVWKLAFDRFSAEPSRLDVLLVDARVVLVAIDSKVEPDLPTVWIEHEAVSSTVGRSVVLEFVGTGMVVPAGVHVGSCINADGFVWHVYAQGLR